MIGPDTQEISSGPVTLDVVLARKLGWTQEQIDGAWYQLSRISVRETEYAERLNSELFYTTPDGIKVFVGDLSSEAKQQLIDSYEKGT